MTFALGSQVPLAISLVDGAGAPANATTVTLTVTLPDGVTTATPAVVNPSTGSYTASYLPTVPGWHTVRWVLTGAPGAAPPVDGFLVVGASAVVPVSLQDLRKHLNWPATKSSVDDVELLDIAAEATTVIEGEIGFPLLPATFTESRTVDPGHGWHLARDGGRAEGRTTLVLGHAPCLCSVCAPTRVLAVQQVVESGTVLATTGVYELTPAGVLYRGSTMWPQPWLPGTTVITWTAGFTAPPRWATLAVKRMTEHLWMGSQQARHERGANTPRDPNNRATFLLPYAVQSLIDPHSQGV